MEDRTSVDGIRGIKDSTEGFYDRTGDSQAHTQPISLRRKEMLENPLANLFREPGPEVAHCRTDSTGRFRSSPERSSGEHHPSEMERCPLHRVKSVQNQI